MQYDLVEYCRLRPSDTGLSVDIFLDDGGAYKRNKNPLLAYMQNDYGDVAKVLPIDVESANRITSAPPNLGILFTDYQKVLEFVSKNKELIRQLADGQIEHLDFYGLMQHTRI